MSDFYGCLSSTSFRVKDRKAWLSDPEVQQIKEYAQAEGFFEEEEGYWAFGWEGQYPAVVISKLDEEGEPQDLDITEVIERHIHPDDVCQIGVSGNEKLRYIGGPLWFVSAKGATVFDAETCWEVRLTVHDIKDRMRAAVHNMDQVL